ncbi:MAG TPA: sialidase family protein [Mycobacteriales bacterium]|nr:sialidase family protein [Mycobacteriales bacterium]
MTLPQVRALPLAVASAVALTALVTATPGAAATPSPPRWDAPVLVSEKQAARETSIVLDPTNPKRQFICSPSGVPATSTGQSYFYLSSDGGKTWRYENVEDSATDNRKAAFEGGDCDVAFDQGGTMYTADTWLGNLSIGHSTDRGESWQGTAISGTSPIIDRPWLVGGPKGTLYVTYQDLQCCMPSAMWFMKSTDFGKTFSPAVSITTADSGGAYTWEGNFVVSPSGKDLYLVYLRRSSGLANTGRGVGPQETVWVAQSHDGGASWKSHLIATLPQETTTIYPSIGMDAGGGLHVVWSAPAAVGNPISYTSSTDKGLTWRAPVELNPGKVGLAPWIVGGKKGEAAVAWLGSPNPKATAQTVADYYFSWAKVRHSGGRVSVTTGNTTKAPVFTGKQVVPEFEMLSLDAKGKMHLGMSVYRSPNRWAIYSQSER